MPTFSISAGMSSASLSLRVTAFEEEYRTEEKAFLRTGERDYTIGVSLFLTFEMKIRNNTDSF